MKPNKLSVAMLALMGGAAIPADALELYVDTKTSQIFAEPGPGRVKLGSFERVDEAPAEGKGARAAKPEREEMQVVEERLNKKIDALANKPKDPKAASVKLDGKGIRFETNDGNFKFNLNGRLHTDANLNSGGDIKTWEDSNNNGIVDGDEAESITTNRLTDGTEIRRFRMEFAATFFEHWKMKMQPEFSNSGGDGTVGIRDAYVQYTGFDWGEWTVGQSKQPFSLQQMMSSNDMVFMERSLEYEFTNRQVNRAIGIRYDASGNNWGLGVGWYGDTATRQSSGTTSAEDEGWGVSGRITHAPLFKPGELIHVGVSAAYRQPRDGDPTLRYRVAPSAIDHVNYLDTGTMENVQNSEFFNAEAAAVYGPFSIEGEYTASWVNRDGGFDDGFLQGFHVDLAYSLTGESRTGGYDPKWGVFKRIAPNQNFDLAGGWGAWELKARTMYVDMNDIGQTGQTGGRELASTFGVNWYWNNWARFMVDWTHVWDLDVGTAQDFRKVLPGSGNSSNDWDQVSARVSLAY
jgi:phosphate-selective porin OprO/OprP